MEGSDGMSDNIRIVFMGTPDFATSALSALYEAGMNIVGVFTKPDTAAGRGMKAKFSDVKKYALEKGLDVYQPETFKDGACLELLESLAPDMIIVAAYGKLLPPYVIDFPKYGCINIHGSILPKYRGAAPIQRAVLNGDEETGVTIMKMNYGMDTGDILKIAKVKISDVDSTGDIFDRLAEISRPLIVEAVSEIVQGKLIPVPQNEAEATHADKIRPEDEIIDWSKSAREVHNKIRGLSPFPGAKTTLGGKLVKVYASSLIDFEAPATAGIGEVVECRKASLFVKCGDSCIALQSLKPEGAKLLSSTDMINGRKVSLGDIFQ